MSLVFVNYRVADQPLGAAAIHDALARRFGADQVFRDCVSMQAGEHYPTELRQALEKANLLVSVIGPHWLTVAEAGTGLRLIDRTRDWVRGELTRAFQRRIPVLPVLLDGAEPPRADQLPEGITQLAQIQAMEVSQRRFGDDLERLARRIVQLVPKLVVPRLFVPPPEPPGAFAAPSTLLRPEYTVVPFAGRAREIADLRAWATDSVSASAQLVVGPAGSGKTRLALRLCEQLVASGWLAGIVQGRPPAAQIRDTSAIDRPLLMVVDDAETRADQLTALAAAIGDRSAVKHAPVRLLLVSRAEGGWLDGLRAHGDKRVAELFKTIGRWSVLRLSATDFGAQYATAKAAFAEILDLPDTEGGRPAQLGTLLDVHAAALHDVLGGTPADAPVAALARHDRRHLRGLLRSAGQSDLDTAGFATIAAVATLCGPASAEEAAALMERLPHFLAASPEKYVAWLHLCYPGPHPLAPIQPDALGEAMVAATLAAQPSLAATLAAVCPDEQIVNALTVLGRALPRRPDLAQAVVDLVRVAPAHLVTLGVDVAIRLEEPEPFVRALGVAIGGRRLSTDDVFVLMNRLQTRNPVFNPLRGALMTEYVEVFAKPVAGEAGQNTPVPPGLAGLHQLGERLTTLMTDAFVGFVDPGSGRFPTGPEGESIVPRNLLDILRRLTVDGTWFPDDKEE